MASRTFSEIMRERVAVLAQQDPDSWVKVSDIAFQVGRAMGRAYHSYKAQRLLQGTRVTPDKREVAAWMKATGLDVDRDAAAEAWHAAGLLPPGTTRDEVRLLLDQREASNAAARTSTRASGWKINLPAQRLAHQRVPLRTVPLAA